MTEAVFLFDRDRDLNVFASRERAEGWMEAIDVEAGEYVAAFRQDGTRFTPTVRDGVVTLAATGEVDAGELSERLREFATLAPSAPQTSDPGAFAQEWLKPRPRARLFQLLARGRERG